MIEQILNIKEIGWNLRIFYNPKTSSHRALILKNLFDAGCKGYNYRRAQMLLNSGCFNVGLTFTNKEERQTIIVIGRSSNMGEFLNTLTHEINHFISHVMEHLGIEQGDEDEAYFTGELYELIYQDAVHSILPLL